jgi:Helix-loop-helix DNA-binding domain
VRVGEPVGYQESSSIDDVLTDTVACSQIRASHRPKLDPQSPNFQLISADQSANNTINPTHIPLTQNIAATEYEDSRYYNTLFWGGQTDSEHLHFHSADHLRSGLIPLSPLEIRELYAIAMSTDQQDIEDISDSPTPHEIDKVSSGVSPTKESKTQKKGKREVRRKPSKGEGSTRERATHNLIEKRYRGNLNNKIAELRDSVPNLRSPDQNKAEGGSTKGEFIGYTDSRRINKAS